MVRLYQSGFTGLQEAGWQNGSIEAIQSQCAILQFCNLLGRVTLSEFRERKWRNWQTRRT